MLRLCSAQHGQDKGVCSQEYLRSVLEGPKCYFDLRLILFSRWAMSPIKLQTVSLSPRCRLASPRPQPLSYLSTRTLQAPCPLRIYHNVHEHGLATSNTTSSWSQTRCWPRSTPPRTSSCRTSPVSVSASSRPPSPLLSQRVAAAQPGRSGTASGD